MVDDTTGPLTVTTTFCLTKKPDRYIQYVRLSFKQHYWGKS